MSNETPANVEPAENGDATETTETNVDPVTALKAQFEELLKEEKNKYLYLYAEFDNHKKRVIKERSDLIKFGWESVARELVGVVDNLERAIEHMPENTDKNLKTGIEMVLSQFHNALQKHNVVAVQTIGLNFNPEIHEAMGQEPSDRPQGEITHELVKGYTLHGRLLRPARVIISSGQFKAT